MEKEICTEKLSKEDKKEFLKQAINDLENEKLLDYFCIFVPEKIKRAQ